MSQNQGWGQQPSQPGWSQQPGQQDQDQPPGQVQPPGQQGWGQQPPPGPPPSQPPPGGGQPAQWGAPPPPGQPGRTTKQCPTCGSIIDVRALDCPRCGVRQPDVVYEEAKSRPLAIVLALLLGGFGIHRFYVGPVSWGIAYLIFFWTGIPGFLAWLEAIYWLTRNDVEWAQKYGGPVRQSNSLAIGCLWIVALLPLIAIALVGAAILLAIPLAFV